MIKKTLTIIGIFVLGAIAGSAGNSLIKPAYAAASPIIVQSTDEIIAKCDFTKSIVVARQVICVQK